MSDDGIRTEWFKLVLDELRKNNDKLDKLREDMVDTRATFDAHEDKDEERHRNIMDILAKYHVSLEEYNKQLEEHIRGVQALEKRQDSLWARVEPVVKTHEEETIAHKYLSAKAMKRVKWIAAIGTVAGAATAILKLLGMF